MAAILEGNTATKVISNTHILKIQLIDDERLFYQFIDVADQKAYEIVEAEIKYSKSETDLADDDFSPCFYLEGTYDGEEVPYFLSEFIRDGYPELPKGKLTSLSSNGWNT